MARGPSTFKQRDVTRALKATVAAGIEVAKVEIATDGTIIVVAASAPVIACNSAKGDNPWDKVLENA
jgi:hypothetical protein